MKKIYCVTSGEYSDWKISYAFELKLNIFKVAILIKLNYGFKANTTKIPATFFAKTDNLHLKIIWKYKGPEYPKQS